MEVSKTKTPGKFITAIITVMFCINIFINVCTTALAAQTGSTGNVSWSLDDKGVLSVYGEGATGDYSGQGTAPWSPYADSITSIVIGGDIDYLGTYAFADLTNVTSVTIGKSVYNIGEYCFYGCSSLKEVTIPPRVHNVYYGAFGETGLTKVTVLSRCIQYPDNDDWENALTFPESAVFYTTYNHYTDIYAERNNRTIVYLYDEMLARVENGESGFEFTHHDYYNANIWKAVKEEAEPEDDILLDYTFTIDADEAMEEHNHIADSSSQKIDPSYNNGGEIYFEAEIDFYSDSTSFSNVNSYASYGYTEFDPLNSPKENYQKWKIKENSNPYITITPNGKTAVVRVQGKLSEIYAYANGDKPSDAYKTLESVSVHIEIDGRTYKKNSKGTYCYVDYDKQLEYRYMALYDVHRRYVEISNPGPKPMDAVSTVLDYPPDGEGLSDYMEPISKEYVWDYDFSRMSREYVEELDRNPGDGGYDDDIYFEEYGGVTYGHVRGILDKGSNPNICYGDFRTDETGEFINSLVGVMPSGTGGEVMIMLGCNVTFTFPDGETNTIYIDSFDECAFITKPCMHACLKCGLCTVTDRSTSCNRVGWVEMCCQCEESEESIVVTETATEDEVSFENNTWVEDATLEVTFVNVAESLESPYIKEIDKTIEVNDTVMLFDVSLYAYEAPYTMNEWGGNEESITVTLEVGQENAELIEKGEAELVHLGQKGAETVECIPNTSNGTITFTANSLSPFAIIRKNMTDCRHYGRTFLNEKQAEIYDAIDMAIKNAEDEIKIDQNLELKYEDIKLIMEMVTADHPDYFWYKGAFSYSRISNQIVVAVTPVYDIDGKTVTKEDIAPYREKFNAGVKAVMDEMKAALPNGTDYDKALWLHDKVANIITYKKGKNHQTAYGALIDGEAVCAGYAKLYQDLLIEANIPVWSIKGSSINPTTGSVETHEWNILWLDGNCVYADVTWDDQGIELFHVYFARDITAMGLEHVPDPNIYADKVPTCTPGKCDTYNYFEKVSPEYALEDELTTEYLIDIMQTKTEGKTYVMTVYDANATAFGGWVTQENINKLINQAYQADKIPAGSYSISMNSMGHEGIGTENHLVLYVMQSETGFIVNRNENTITVDMSVNGNDYYNNNLKVGLVFYDENNTALNFKIEQVNPNEIYTAPIPNGAKEFKAILLNSDNLKPMCTAGKITLK